MSVLLDTCVLAELRKPSPAPQVVHFISTFADEALFLSVLTVGEITKGIELLPQCKKKRELTQWLLGLQEHYNSRILGVDIETAVIWGRITALGNQSGVTIPAVDGLLAATALRYGLTIVTRNIRHFQDCGVQVLDPWVAPEKVYDP